VLLPLLPLVPLLGEVEEPLFNEPLPLTDPLPLVELLPELLPDVPELELGGVVFRDPLPLVPDGLV